MPFTAQYKKNITVLLKEHTRVTRTSEIHITKGRKVYLFAGNVKKHDKPQARFKKLFMCKEMTDF